jgi:hypothetical protein
MNSQQDIAIAKGLVKAVLRAGRIAGLREAADIASEGSDSWESEYAAACECITKMIRSRADQIEKDNINVD